MSKKGKELKARHMENSLRFQYLSNKDRYIFAADEPKYRFNIIGAGNIGVEHMQVTMMEGRATINGVYDPNGQSVENFKRIFSGQLPDQNLVEYSTLAEACNDPRVDGLIICTPNYTHIDIVKEAVKSGKHILLEKPMASTLQDAYEMSQFVKNYSPVFQVGLQYRYKSIYIEAIHESLQRKSIGDIKTISILEHRVPFLDKVKQWNKFSRYSGGTLVEKCCHYFDLFNLFAQAKPVYVHATGGRAVNFLEFEYDNETSDIIDHAFVTVVYENGIHASFNLCMFAPMFYEEMILCGDEGRLKVSENEDALSIDRPRNTLELMCGEGKPSKITYPSYPKFIEESGHGGATYYSHQYFIDNIEGEDTMTATVDEGFWSIVVGAAAEESVKTGKTIYIDELLKQHDIAL